jgi:hypothetical protein
MWGLLESVRDDIYRWRDESSSFLLVAHIASIMAGLPDGDNH